MALGLARGLSQIEAVKQAGYADSTAEKKACRIVQRPQTKPLAGRPLMRHARLTKTP